VNLQSGRTDNDPPAADGAEDAREDPQRDQGRQRQARREHSRGRLLRRLALKAAVALSQTRQLLVPCAQELTR
jgi:hypothetical protein